MATTPLAPNHPEDPDALTSLEQRILRAVQLVNKLRQDKSDLEAENLRLMEEVENLQNDRKSVRTRIEKLLGQIDQFAT